MVYDKSSEEYIKNAILKTIIYSDIFDFPLRKEELWRFLMVEKRVDFKVFDIALKQLQGRIILQSGYYCLRGREKIIEKRIAGLSEVDQKMQLAKKACAYLAHIPTILFIGISGGLAMGDVEKDDDIDFFIITKANTLFKTRLFVLLMLELSGLRRKRSVRKASNKICVNFLIDEMKLAFPPERHEIYTAHEIAQVAPLFERNHTYSKFLSNNSWIKDFLPNALIDRKSIPPSKRSIIVSILCFIGHYLSSERLLRRLQIEFMKNHRKSEIVTRHLLILTPHDYRVQTLKDLRLKLQKVGLLTKE